MTPRHRPACPTSPRPLPSPEDFFNGICYERKSDRLWLDVGFVAHPRRSRCSLPTLTTGVMQCTPEINKISGSIELGGSDPQGTRLSAGGLRIVNAEQARGIKIEELGIASTAPDSNPDLVAPVGAARPS